MNGHRHECLMVIAVVFIFLSMLPISSCDGGTPSQKRESPAEVVNPVTESELATIKLTPQAEERLGVETAIARREQVPGFLEVGGEVIAPPGTAVRVSAPVAGTIMHLQTNAVVQAGSVVKRGQEIMRLLLMPAEQDLVGTREDVAVKQIEYDVAQAKVKRSEALLKDDAISEKAHQEAAAELAVANAALKAAKAKMKMLSGSGVEADDTDQSILVFKAPIDGVVQHIYVASGQTVAASTDLFEVASQRPVWVRVPVYSGHLGEIDRKKAALIYSMGADPVSASVEAAPLEGPLLSDAQSVSSDLFYKYENNEGRFRIGERVMVKLVLGTGKESIIVPGSAVIHDIYNGTWVYLKTAPYTYSRRRVEVSRMADGFAVITRGIREGDEIVVIAAAELYGTEFGGGE
jgi:cobalt-zinc-cadmium efflux system membrane fusion protein